MQIIKLEKYKEIASSKFLDKAIPPSKIKDLTLPDEYKVDFPNSVGKKLLNQNRFIIEVDESDIEPFFTFLANYSFIKEKMSFKDWFKKINSPLKKSDLKTIKQMIDNNVTHSLKTINTNFNGNLYFPKTESVYGLTSSDFEESIGFSTTEGNATVNSKHPLFYFNFLFNGKAYNFIEFINESENNKKIGIKVLSRFFEKPEVEELIDEITNKENVLLGNTLGYQIIVNDNENDFITLSPCISIKSLQRFSMVNKSYVNSLDQKYLDENELEALEELSDEDREKLKREFFLQRISYGLGGDKPQNISPYFSFQSGRVNAFKSYIPNIQGRKKTDKLINEIIFKDSLIKNAYLKNDEIKPLKNKIIVLYEIEKKGENSKSKIIAKSLIPYIRRSFEDLKYAYGEIDLNSEDTKQLLLERRVISLSKNEKNIENEDYDIRKLKEKLTLDSLEFDYLSSEINLKHRFFKDYIIKKVEDKSDRFMTKYKILSDNAELRTLVQRELSKEIIKYLEGK